MGGLLFLNNGLTAMMSASKSWHISVPGPCMISCRVLFILAVYASIRMPDLQTSITVQACQRPIKGLLIIRALSANAKERTVKPLMI